MIEFRFDLDSGDSINLVPKEIWPLGFHALLREIKTGSGELRLEFVGENAVVNGEKKDGHARAETKVSFLEPINVYALFKGGWLPPPFVLPPNLLVDRNVVAAFKKINLGQTGSYLVSVNWWFQLFQKGYARFNPLLYALEGHKKQAPTFDEFVSEFDEGAAEIASAFSKEHVVSYGPLQYQAAYQFVQELATRAENETAFLLDVVPLIVARAPNHRLAMIEAKIFDAAHKHQLLRRSLVVIAALSCLYDDLHGIAYSVGRGVLKPSPQYGVTQAYNALADLHHIELSLPAQAQSVQEPFAFCTCDKPLALFWCALKPTDIHVSGNEVNYSLTVDRCLFPRLTDAELDSLSDRLAS